MGDTYCGKLCEDCQFKDNLQCPGCKTGPGKTWMTECELAKCCMLFYIRWRKRSSFCGISRANNPSMDISIYHTSNDCFFSRRI